ncbi:hypothetical protein NO263_09965 [Gluconacetobacter entanii]|uniref:Phage tail protein n=1 Tax=Gluconacetobacter entanii TaxID=108528 RepID=A0ABT3K667_9PROT|nr:hypothetical protein [Gluconacetobacter entanii]MCW4590905.1 hypothetical protein [Gluconacetobacter entanii]MCW4592524.1 hypothetical protein [Gluconacetobacter entanii]NPC87322.1 hypothetical protein [Gluconacetobacter entanii]
MQPDFTQKALDVTFRVASGGFGAGGADTLTLSGLRCHAEVTHAGMPSGSTLSLRIGGMDLPMMNRLSVLSAMPVATAPQQQMQACGNTVMVQATHGDGKVAVFRGVVVEAFVDFSTMPDVAFVVTASSIAGLQVQPLPPDGYAGAVSVQTVLSDIAAQCGLRLVAHNLGGVMIHDHYGWGCARDRIERIRHAAGIVINIQDNTLTAWGRDLATDGTTGTPPVISAGTGLLGYPAYNQDGVAFRTLFRPDIAYLSPVQVCSVAAPGGLSMASGGLWTPYRITHQLESEVPDGAWFTHVAAMRTGSPAAGG